MQNKTLEIKLGVFFVIFFGNYLMFSQTVNGKPLQEIDTHYLQVTLSYPELFDSTVNLKLDYGQEYKSIKNSFLLDSNGKKMQFHSFVDASNFLFKSGFEYFDVKFIRNENVNLDSYIYTFKKQSSK